MVEFSVPEVSFSKLGTMIALGTLLIFLRHFEGGVAYGRSHVGLSLASQGF